MPTIVLPWGLLKPIADNPGSGFSVARVPQRQPNPEAGPVRSAPRGGLGGAEDVAVFKLGTPDIEQGNGTISETAKIPQTTWFNTVYKPTMDALAAAYPGTTFVHATVPVRGAGAYWGNVHYEQWNNLLRANYPGRLFDLAKWQSVNASGRREQSADGAPCIHADWQISGDAHVNQAGANWLGQHLLELLASIPWRRSPGRGASSQGMFHCAVSRGKSMRSAASFSSSQPSGTNGQMRGTPSTR